MAMKCTSASAASSVTHPELHSPRDFVASCDGSKRLRLGPIPLSVNGGEGGESLPVKGNIVSPDATASEDSNVSCAAMEGRDQASADVRPTMAALTEDQMDVADSASYHISAGHLRQSCDKENVSSLSNVDITSHAVNEHQLGAAGNSVMSPTSDVITLSDSDDQDAWQPVEGRGVHRSESGSDSSDMSEIGRMTETRKVLPVPCGQLQALQDELRSEEAKLLLLQRLRNSQDMARSQESTKSQQLAKAPAAAPANGAASAVAPPRTSPYVKLSMNMPSAAAAASSQTGQGRPPNSLAARTESSNRPAAGLASAPPPPGAAPPTSAHQQAAHTQRPMTSKPSGHNALKTQANHAHNSCRPHSQPSPARSEHASGQPKLSAIQNGSSLGVAGVSRPQVPSISQPGSRPAVPQPGPRSSVSTPGSRLSVPQPGLRVSLPQLGAWPTALQGGSRPSTSQPGSRSSVPQPASQLSTPPVGPRPPIPQPGSLLSTPQAGLRSSVSRQGSQLSAPQTGSRPGSHSSAPQPGSRSALSQPIPRQSAAHSGSSRSAGQPTAFPQSQALTDAAAMLDMEQRQRTAKLVQHKQLLKALMQIQPPRPVHRRMDFVPALPADPSGDSFLYLLGLEEAVKYLTRKVSTEDPKVACKPLTCVKCSRDFSPSWKCDKPGSSDVVCEPCLVSKQRYAIHKEHASRLSRAFDELGRREKELEQQLQQHSVGAATLAAALPPAPRRSVVASQQPSAASPIPRAAQAVHTPPNSAIPANGQATIPYQQHAYDGMIDRVKKQIPASAEHQFQHLPGMTPPWGLTKHDAIH